MRHNREEFALALRNARAALHMTQNEFGALVEVAPRTLTRWETHGELPPPARRTYLLLKLAPRLAAAHLAALASAMDVDAGVAAALGAGGTTTTRPAVDTALWALAEELDVSARKLRPAVGRFLQRLEAAGASVADARAALAKQA